MDGEPRPQHRRGRAGRRGRHAPAYAVGGQPLTDARAEWADGRVVVRGSRLADVLAVAPLGALALGADLVPTAGSWRRLEGEAWFTPRFATVPGTSYVVIERRDDHADAWRELARIHVPESDRASSTFVEAIEPGVDEVPANLLRFSVTFSDAMDEGSAAGRIHLLDERGVELSGALLEMPPELWDRDRRRLTVLLEPGRIKRGLQPNALAGSPLRQGHPVTIVVEAGIRDAEGSQLLREAGRTYRVGAPVRSRIDPNLWNVRWPDSNSAELIVDFDRPLDRVLVQRYLQVVDGEQPSIAGHNTLDDDGLRWVFTPTDMRTGIQLRVDARLEDLAGNSVRRVFDRDLDGSVDDEIDAPTVILSPGAR